MAAHAAGIPVEEPHGHQILLRRGIPRLNQGNNDPLQDDINDGRLTKISVLGEVRTMAASASRGHRYSLMGNIARMINCSST